jgi:ribosome-associated toxin RatA of RatAB toxin-antitoxin module
MERRLRITSPGSVRGGAARAAARPEGTRLEPALSKNLRRCRAWLLAACTVSAAALGAEHVSVETQRRGALVEVSARATLRAPQELVWQALTDYNRLAQFIPGMRYSRVIERRGATAIVEQQGEARFLFFAFPIEVTLASTERPPHAIDVRLVRGNLGRLEGGYRIERPRDGSADALILRWEGVVEPGEPLPPLLGEAVMRANIEDQFTGMVREIERRMALRSSETRGTLGGDASGHGR